MMGQTMPCDCDEYRHILRAPRCGIGALVKAFIAAICDVGRIRPEVAQKILSETLHNGLKDWLVGNISLARCVANAAASDPLPTQWCQMTSRFRK
jgi:hypothetical protein